MNLTKKIAKFLALIFLALPLFSCEEGCIEADQFDSLSVTIESKPNNIYGTYDPITGGQRVDWKDTGLRSNGKPILIHIGGSWMSLNGTRSSDEELGQLPLCNLCSKRDGVDNCICRPDQNPEAENDISGLKYTLAADGVTPLNCANNPSHQDDAERCTCTKQHGKTTDYGVYSFPLDVLTKSETVKIADQQRNCRYNRGVGAYLSLWGRRGVDTPTRAYHLYSEDSVCKIKRNSNGECKDPLNRDFTKYVFRSANSNTFIKDDQNGNDNIDNNTANDIYHGKNELLKTIMYDRYYNDNYGKYNLNIYGGFGEDGDKGLIEFLVTLVENMLLGKENKDGVREGGIVRYMYQAVVQDSGFASLVRVSLSLYIAIFGAAHLWGLAEMNKTEVGKRFLKIGLIMFFISPNSWTFYNEFVIKFFKDGMDSVITLFMTADDYNLISDTSSNAGRFRYIDLMIKNLMSEAVAKKIISLFFSDPLGLLYIPIIYALIFAFIAVMLYIATIYLTNLMKIIFVLAIGPIFFVFSLFQQTFQYFSNWLSYLAGRSFEMIVLFLILYMFLTIIDKNFTEMLLYRTCTESFGVGPIQVLILKAEINRGIIGWCLLFFTIISLIFIMWQVIEKVPEIAGSLFALQIGGKSSSGGFGDPDSKAAYGGRMAGALAGAAASVGAAGLGVAAKSIGSPIATLGFKGLNAIGNATGINAVYNKLTGGGIAGSNMNKAWNEALKASGGDEQKARDNFMDSMRAQIDTSPAKMAALGINEKSMSAFLDNKLVVEPLQAKLKEAAKEMKNMPAGQIPIGEAAIANHLSNVASDWAKKNMTESSQRKVSELLKTDGIKSLMNEHGTMSGSEAARALRGNKEAQDKFRADLAHRQFEQSQKGAQAAKYPVTVGIGRAASNLQNYIGGSAYNNAGIEAKNFERGLARGERDMTLGDKVKDALNPRSIQFVDRALLGNKDVEEKTKQSKLDIMRTHLAQNPYQKDTSKMTREDRLAANKENQKNQFFRDELRKSAAKDALNDSDRAKALRDFDKKDGRNLFEKAAHLSEINKKLNIGGEDPQTRLAKLLAEEAKNAAKDAKEATSKEGRAKAEERLKKLEKGMFGEDISEDVMLKFREGERAKSSALSEPLDNRSSKDLDKEIDLQHEKIKESLLDKEKEKIEEIGDKTLKEAAAAATNEEAKKIIEDGTKELLKESPSILPKGLDFDDMFGKGFTDVLLSGMKDLGLKAGQIIPGMNPNEKDPEIDQVKLNSMKMTENQLLGQIKLAKMDLQIKEIELQQLGISGDPKKIAAINKEIAELNKAINVHQRTHEQLESSIKEVSKSAS